MTFSVKTSTNIPEFWDENLSKNKSSTGYQISSWGMIYQESYNSTPLFLEVTKNNDLAAQLLVLLHANYSWRDANPLATKLGEKLNMKNSLDWIYGPIIHDSSSYTEIIEAILSELDSIAKENNVNNIRGTIPPLFEKSTEQIFKKFGYSSTSWATHVIDLQQDEQSIYTELDKKTRYYIRKIGRAHV